MRFVRVHSSILPVPATRVGQFFVPSPQRDPPFFPVAATRGSASKRRSYFLRPSIHHTVGAAHCGEGARTTKPVMSGIVIQKGDTYDGC